MLGKQVKVEITWHLDQVPGWNHQPEDVIENLKKELDRISHYKPTIKLVES